MSWSGPYRVLECKNKVTYRIDEKGTPKLYHINLLKRYHRRNNVHQIQVLDEPLTTVTNSIEPFQTVHMCMVEEGGDHETRDMPLTPDGRVDSLQGSNGNVPEQGRTRHKRFC